MTTNIATLFGKNARNNTQHPKSNWPLPDCLTGLEIEVETITGVTHPTNYAPYWACVKDGSLRNGKEYVLAMPQKGDPLANAIHTLYASPTKFLRSPTGSTHIHLDMLEEDMTQLKVKILILLMYVFESAIFAIADRGREWCGYTNKLTSAPEVLIAAVLNATEDDGYMEFTQLCLDRYQLGRYYGINVMALAKYGSLEFRYFPTATSAEELIDWVCLVQNFKLAAMEMGSLENLIEMLEDEELYDRFLNKYFAKWKDYFVQEIPQITAMSNVRKALAIASAQAFHRTAPKTPFNDRAVLGNKRLSQKFIKNTAGVTVRPVMFSSERAPEPNTVPPGTVMFHRNHLYVSTPNDWMTFPFRDGYGERLSAADRTKALKSLYAAAPRLADTLNNGPVPRNTYELASANNQFRDAIFEFERQLNLEHRVFPELSNAPPSANIAGRGIDASTLRSLFGETAAIPPSEMEPMEDSEEAEEDYESDESFDEGDDE